MNCPEPTEELVRAACAKFDKENRITEEALNLLFGQYPSNNRESHVLLKVVAVNSLYWCNIYAVHALASHIHGSDIDSALAIGSPDAVDKIERFPVSEEKDRGCFVFATKYCSWHKPESYPIWDGNVERYFECLYKKTSFEEFNFGGHWKYRRFFEAMTFFRKHYGLGKFSFKDIDKFLWSEGEEPNKRAG